MKVSPAPGGHAGVETLGLALLGSSASRPAKCRQGSVGVAWPLPELVVSLYPCVQGDVLKRAIVRKPTLLGLSVDCSTIGSGACQGQCSKCWSAN